jgi:tetratricopeptide (TPR) repeat protein
MTHLLRLAFLCVVPAILVVSCNSDRGLDEHTGDLYLGRSIDFSDRGLYGIAIDTARPALAIFETLRLERRMAAVERQIGRCYAGSADFEQGLQYLNRAYQHFRGSAERAESRDVLLEIAAINRDIGEDGKALDLLDEGWRVAGIVGDPDGQKIFGTELITRARDLSKGDYADRIKASVSPFAGDDRKLMAWLSADSAHKLVMAGMHGAAATQYGQASDQWMAAGDTLAGIEAMRKEALEFARHGDESASLQRFTQALRIASRHPESPEAQERLFFSVGITMMRSGRSKDAARFFEAAKSSGENRSSVLVRSLAMMLGARNALASNPGGAFSAIDQAMEYLQGARPPALMACLLGLRGDALLALNKPADALDSFRKAIAETEKSHYRFSSDELVGECLAGVQQVTPAPWHDEACDLLLRLGKTPEAASIAFRRASLAHVRSLEMLPESSVPDKDKELRERLRSARGMLAGSEAALYRAIASPIGFEERVGSINKRFESASGMERTALGDYLSARPELKNDLDVQSPDPRSLTDQVPVNSSLIIYSVTSRSVQEFVINSSGVSARSVAMDASKLIALCRNASERFTSAVMYADSSATLKTAGRTGQAISDADELYDVFVRPVDRQPASVRNLGIVYPVGVPFIPIHSLRRNGVAGTSLIERYTVWFQDVPGMPADASQRAVRSVRASGNPGNSGRDVEYELRDIKGFYPDAVLVLNEAATLTDLTAARGDLLHLGLEIFWDALRPSVSYVLFPDERTQVLHEHPVRDIAAIRGFSSIFLNNYSPEPGNGPIPIASLLLAGGVKDVIINGFGAGRKSTKMFNTGFFSALQGGMTLPEAYRAAMLEAARHPDIPPVFWMSWIYVRRVSPTGPPTP